jgi:predicted metallo-beta-lactamase superfamily hydrolase
MDPRVREVIEGAMKRSESELRTLEPLVDSKMGSVLDTCFSKNSSNPDRFADCILGKNKRVEEIMKSIEFKILYFSKAATNCLVKRSVAECTEDTIKGLKEVIDNSKKAIEKL